MIWQQNGNKKSDSQNHPGNENMQSIIEILQAEGKNTPQKAIAVCGKSAATNRRYFKVLQKTGYVVSEGSTNNVIYKVKDNWVGYVYKMSVIFVEDGSCVLEKALDKEI